MNLKNISHAAQQNSRLYRAGRAIAALGASCTTLPCLTWGESNQKNWPFYPNKSLLADCYQKDSAGNTLRPLEKLEIVKLFGFCPANNRCNQKDNKAKRFSKEYSQAVKLAGINLLSLPNMPKEKGKILDFLRIFKRRNTLLSTSPKTASFKAEAPEAIHYIPDLFLHLFRRKSLLLTVIRGKKEMRNKERWDLVITDINLHGTKSIILNMLWMSKQREEKREWVQRNIRGKANK